MHRTFSISLLSAVVSSSLFLVGCGSGFASAVNSPLTAKHEVTITEQITATGNGFEPRMKSAGREKSDESIVVSLLIQDGSQKLVVKSAHEGKGSVTDQQKTDGFVYEIETLCMDGACANVVALVTRVSENQKDQSAFYLTAAGANLKIAAVKHQTVFKTAAEAAAAPEGN